jgi:hypothetical protein
MSGLPESGHDSGRFMSTRPNVARIEPHSARRRLNCQSPLTRSAAVLAEIYMLRLEAAALAAKEAARSSSPFVPVSLSAVKAS